MKLPEIYYRNPDILFLAKDLLGKILYTCTEGNMSAGMIVETEAYGGIADKASHAYGGRRTGRTETMYQNGGVAYVYLCYGIHYLFNVVTSWEDDPQAVLIRAVEPLSGQELMQLRRNMQASKPAISSGPGSAAKALGIDRSLNGKDLTGDEIWIEDHGISYAAELIVSGPRIGVAYAGEDALLAWRFYVRGNRYVSKPRS
ncbi:MULTISPECIES: DNA-3-methyladenine glycosylase [Chryseobacterium]|uniref:Putative 3-methyladenine DNA glycosylase n=1 Tax=Chryseobacterium camelliae TaxID=1265445 RepID=A0ABU0TGN7_9FLAO|nr:MULTISPECIES: DNA-3-methyladenine glycosylase [Chryseobacterium]MDT3405972.1 DNA-3-methyladenine glycosylase [Pseudacidovorax intermedius]MDQ1096225.1 DNA-3-methyladenine glycosylase [Chryseobacterium camelliae]MDQ1100162.1 DNA-3-methyladenine glycosylase [Chryseobacterium sp. SORGH_AS_1048]MDR6087505.1 DNA-3-methyladenine glycosylase [Chryseobacterium sp. SORGH_AS_0909]MDR6131879.1 DNA-3-methyladenine glycosylase [Chryseobacterium sp. SORGH_AS_1175]